MQNEDNKVTSEPEDIFDDIDDVNDANSKVKPVLENIKDKPLTTKYEQLSEQNGQSDVKNLSPQESAHNDLLTEPPSTNEDSDIANANGITATYSDDSSLEDEVEENLQDVSGDRIPSTPLGDLSHSLSPKYFIQVVRISVNESVNGSSLDSGSSPIGNMPAHKILYTIKSQKKSGRNEVFLVNRFHEDVEWLDHCLLTQNKALGLIIPPLPNKPIESFYLGPTATNEIGPGPDLEDQSGRPLGWSSQVPADQSLVKSQYDKSILQHIHHSFNYDCFNFERYLTLLLQHPVFGSDITLKRFLTEKNAPPHGKFKKGFFDKLTSAVNDMRKVNQSEFDEFFQHERFWNTEYSALLRDCLQCFSKKVEALYQLAQVNGHFSTALSMAHCTGPSIYLSFNQTLQNMSVLFENLKQKYEELQAYYQLTLGFELDFYCRYLESHKDTLSRRNCLLLEYDNSNKAVEKAKQNKKEIARQVKSAAAKTLDECSEVAKIEFTRFHSDQSAQILKSVRNYANANLQKSKDIYDLIATALEDLKAVI